MSWKRILWGGCVLVLFSSLLFSQSLFEVAKKERQRREKLKGKKSLLVTNVDLARVKRAPAVSVPQTRTRQEQTRSMIPAQETSARAETSSREYDEADKMEYQDPRKDPETKLKEARERAELLIFKMKALWQEFHSKSDRLLKDRIQSRIHQASQELAQTRKDEEEARKELKRRRK